MRKFLIKLHIRAWKNVQELLSQSVHVNHNYIASNMVAIDIYMAGVRHSIDHPMDRTPQGIE